MWTPRFSELCQIKDDAVIRYYKDKIDDLTQTDPDMEVIKKGEVPHILGPFNNWHYQPMREMIPFCKMYDDKKPDFIQMAIDSK